MRLPSEQVEMETLLGEEKVITGRAVKVDFTIARILVDEHPEPDKL